MPVRDFWNNRTARRFAEWCVRYERRTITIMVTLDCRRQQHAPTAPCPDCAELIQYAMVRLDRCTFGPAKPACAQCPVHCYLPSQRERMRQVMRRAGPRMLWHRPWLAVVHLAHDAVSRRAGR